jgi:hypothetical protein
MFVHTLTLCRKHFKEQTVGGDVETTDFLFKKKYFYTQKKKNPWLWGENSESGFPDASGREEG